ncbi:VOC family protein [Algibacter sp.]|nr:VOC family protein [Algibacter sp.]MDC1226440.1 VOC family protein [Algibacter sp.]MDC1364960.1 VOC family protein [Algibacter sp.]
MKLGAFSISLNIKDIKASKQFYETLGFIQFAGDIEKNILTFNLGWDESANKVDPFDDVRTIQKHLKDNRLKLESEADENTSGPTSMVMYDPDGNTILIDQHV